MPPAMSKVKGTGNSCLSVGTPANGKCGSYYCGVDMNTLAPEINPNMPCGGDPAFACEGSLTKIVTDCAVAHATDTDSDVQVTACVKANSAVMTHNVKDTCIQCFTDAAKCCQADFNCLTTCLVSGGTKTCDDAQKAANCIKPNFACSGLPDPL
jgi:hypothetical protein